MSRSKKTIIINGKFISQNITGVQRYAREILLELDKIIDGTVNLILAIDNKASNIPKFQNIKVVKIGMFNGNLWEQISLPLYVIKKRAFCLNLCNMAPILTPHIVVIHDVSYKVNKHFFSKFFSLWYNLVFTLIIYRIRRIITVSEFSRDEICRVYRKKANEIAVTYNGWQHFETIDYDCNTLEKYGLTSHNFYFSMSSMAKNKNFKWIAKSAQSNPNMIYAVSGAINNKVFGDVFDFEVPDNLKFLGYVSDEEAKTLMHECKAFLFPTIYEGFGIPPLEALSTGASAIVSDASCMREIFGDSVYYIDPYNADVNLEQILKGNVEPSAKLLEKYSWKNSAGILHKIIIDIDKV